MEDRIQIQVVSDLHLETPRFRPMYSEFTITPRCDNLALLGDIGNVNDDRLFEFLDKQLHQFRHVLYVLGNHEPYDSSVQETVSKMRKFENSNKMTRETHENEASSLGTFVLMDKSRVDLADGITILGCTLFSDIPPEQQRNVSLFVSDFSSIQEWSVEDHNAAHQADLTWLNAEVESIEHAQPDQSIVILTHYSPTIDERANDPEHLEDSRGVNCAFVTDLAGQPCWTSKSVKLWAFGHTHHNCDYVDTKTGKRVVANQRGYGREDIFNFDADMLVSVPL